MFFRKKKLFNHSLKILVGTNALILIAGAMLGPIYALFVEEIGGDLMDASLAGAIFALAAGITTLISGRFADKLKNPKMVVIVGYVIMMIGFLLLTTVNSVWFLFVVQAMIGFGEAIYSPAFDALYSKHIDHHKEGRQWSYWESMNYFTAVIGAVVGGLLASTFGFAVLFVAMASISALSALYLLTIPKKLL
jgi:MFS family permease